MDELKRGGRELDTDMRETTRDLDGTDTKDQIGNMGDEARKEIGNAGDDLKRGLGDLGDDVREGGDRTYPDAKVSDKQY